ncbi:MAG: heme-dependent peroxidase [Bdellovibrionales bacterium]|nr:heme-dependent peroxidase [Bdellovibrionales bacterium]
MGSQFAPDTADGWAVLHQFFAIDWQAIGALPTQERESLVSELSEYLSSMEEYSDKGQSAAYHVLGHKGGLLLLHFRPDFSQCAQIELDIYRKGIAKYLKLSDSYVSIVELGMYHTTKNILKALSEQGLKPHSDEWKAAYEEKIEPHKENLMERRYTEIPSQKYICFYPMDKKRGEKNNWYHEPLDKRAELMMEHGMTGRRYAGKVKQVITGSIGFDDWEWGVDLFADTPNYFKDLVYEMRFDDVTSLYGAFGKFYFGVRLPSVSLREYFDGKLPE